MSAKSESAVAEDYTNATEHKLGDKEASETIAKTPKEDETMEEDCPNPDKGHSTGNAKEEIPKDGLLVQLLARLDPEEYQKSLCQDAGSIVDNFFLPFDLPWHNRHRLPKRFLKTLPRDIDDLHVITHCEDALHEPVGDMKGAFGFGRFENGQARGHYNGPGKDTLFDLNSPTSAQNSIACARRAKDPGVIELYVSLPLPPSIKTVKNTKSQSKPEVSLVAKWKEKLFSHPGNLNVFSHLPYHWEKKQGALANVTQTQDQPPTAQSILQNGAKATGKDQTNNKLQESAEREAMTEEQKLFPTSSSVIAEATADEAKTEASLLSSSMMRKWNISVKVENVSSRSTVFPPSIEVPNDLGKSSEKERKVVRPMLCTAILPYSVQTGVTVSSETASMLDDEGLAYSLGSYDCRFTEKIMTPKKEMSNRSKRIEVGRTRIVWSSLIQGDEPFLPSTRNRINFNSLITGQRVDATKCRRPRELKVGVRLNNKLIMEEAIEDLRPVENKVRKRKHSTRQAENEILDSKPAAVQYPSFRTTDEINAAFRFNLPVHANRSEVKPHNHVPKDQRSAVVYYDVGCQPPPLPEVDRKGVIASLLKVNQKKPSSNKKLKRSASHTSNAFPTSNAKGSRGSHAVATEANQARKYTPPRFACIPLEDGLMRTVCMTPGNMVGSAINQIFCEIARDESEQKCSVCWTSEGSGKEGVHKCVDCGLLAHSLCCLDRGSFFNRPNDATSNTLTSECWRCAVCYHDSAKIPNTNPESPLGAVDDNDNYSQGQANAPGPSCVFCPHAGGAMSIFDPSSPKPHQWAHEVCRVWSVTHFVRNHPASTLSEICALCGKVGGTKTVDGRVKGLTKCAARGCFVAFHPTCALLASKLDAPTQSAVKTTSKSRPTRKASQASDSKKSDRKEIIQEDRKLCNEYTLELVHINEAEENAGETNGGLPAVVPIAFCGIHNRNREKHFYGCLPGGGMMC